MANNVGLEFAAKTDTGLVRAQNEDAIAISPDYGFAVLADGMGGYNAGEVASGMAIAVVRQSLEEGLARLLGDTRKHSRQLQQLITEAFKQSNQAIFRAARNEPRYAGMGTTLVAAIFRHDKVIIAHVGDSRAYRFRNRILVQITRDHSLLQEQIDAGLITPEWARFAQNKNLVTRAVGVGAEVDVEVHEYVTEPGDIYLLCSDGLTDMLQPEEIGEILASRRSSLDEACNSLAQRANELGGHDNISAILIDVKAIGRQRWRGLMRFLVWLT